MVHVVTWIGEYSVFPRHKTMLSYIAISVCKWMIWSPEVPINALGPVSTTVLDNHTLPLPIKLAKCPRVAMVSVA